MSPRILITGADGFVGRHQLPLLRLRFPAARIIAAGRSGTVPPGADAAVIADLMQPESWPQALRAAAPTAVLHLAAQASVPASFADPATTWRMNLGGTLALAEAVLAEAPEAIFVHVSTVEIYGLSFQPGLPLDETALPRPASPYAASKAAADLAIGEMALRGLRAIRLRPANHTGAGQTPAYAVPAFARQAARIAAGLQPPVLQVGALDRWRDFLDVRDVCAAYAAVIARGAELAPGSIFNLASGTPRRVGDVLADLLRIAGISPQIEQAADRLRSTDVVRAVPNAAAARAELGWAPAIPWAQTLADVLDDWRGRLAEG